MDSLPPCPSCAGDLNVARLCGSCGEQWLTQAETARLVGVTKPRIQYLLDTGKLPSQSVPLVRWVARSHAEKLRSQRALGERHRHTPRSSPAA